MRSLRPGPGSFFRMREIAGRGKVNYMNEKGAIGVIVAVVIVVLLMSLALVVDIGQAYQAKRQLQTAVDAAALAAAMDVAQGNSQSVAESTADTYARDNVEGSLEDLDVTFPSAESVRVVARQNKTTFFGGILNRNTVLVAAASTAGGGLATTVNSGIIPINVPYQLIEGHIGSSNPITMDVTTGNWLVNFSEGAVGTPEYDDWFRNGYPDPVSVGDIAKGEGMKAALKDALEARMASNPNLIVPLSDQSEAGSSDTFHVVGFAEFVITDFSLTGNPKTITGYFTTGDVVDGSSSGSGQPLDYGIVIIKLTE